MIFTPTQISKKVVMTTFLSVALAAGALADDLTTEAYKVWSKGKVGKFSHDGVDYIYTGEYDGFATFMDLSTPQTKRLPYSALKADCESKGDGWAIPSLNQIMSVAMYTKHLEYEYNLGAYWTSTEAPCEAGGCGEMARKVVFDIESLNMLNRYDFDMVWANGMCVLSHSFEDL